jgi:hypothetical protein
LCIGIYRNDQLYNDDPSIYYYSSQMGYSAKLAFDPEAARIATTNIFVVSGGEKTLRTLVAGQRGNAPEDVTTTDKVHDERIFTRID